MNTATRNRLLALCSIIAVMATALFWTVWYARNGSVPELSRLTLMSDGESNPIIWTLPFSIYRWWDILLILAWPNLVILTLGKISETKTRAEKEDLHGSLIFGLVAGLILGLDFSTNYLSTNWGLNFGLTDRLIAGLNFNLDLCLMAGLVSGLVHGLGSDLIPGLKNGLVGGLGFGLGFGLAAAQFYGNAFGLAAGLIAGLIFCLCFSLGFIAKFIKSLALGIRHWLTAKSTTKH